MEDNTMQLTGQGSGALNTPIARTENSSQVFGFDPKAAEDKYKRLARDAYRYMLGVMPVSQFLDAFMSRERIMNAHPMPSAVERFHDVRAEHDVNDEDEMYPLLLDALNSKPTLCPGFEFVNTSSRADTSHGVIGSSKPDISCFSSSHLEQLEGSDKDRARMGFAQFFIEVKRSVEYDPFVDPPSGATKEVRDAWEFILQNTPRNFKELAKEILGQNIAYATEIFARQHRHCCFSICLHGLWARFIRWDRAGAIVSEHFHIHSRRNHLAMFLWCYSHMTDSERGYDLTVAPATEVEQKLFYSAVEAHVRSQCPELKSVALEEAVADHVQEGVVSAMVVPTTGNDSRVEYRRFLVSRPIVYPLSPTGRATRGYWAFDTANTSMVFLKDTWRYEVGVTGPDVEGATLEKLNRADVTCVPPVQCHGDVPLVEYDPSSRPDADDAILRETGSFQVTITQNFVTVDWVCGRRRDVSLPAREIAMHTHYRLTLGIVGYSLLHFRGTSELLHATYDILWALRDTRDKVYLFHRDVTPANIILLRDPELGQDAPRRGYLVDWDNAHPIDWVSLGSQPHARSVTWQFQSAYILSGDRPAVEDDMESVFWVVLYCSLIWLAHTGQDTETLARTVSFIFDFACNVPLNDSHPVGGGGKLMLLDRRLKLESFRWNSPLDEWMREVTTALQLYASDEDPTLWEHENLCQYWETFLRKHRDALPLADRSYEVPDVLKKMASRVTDMLPYEATCSEGAISNTATGSKRKAIDQIAPSTETHPKRPNLKADWVQSFLEIAHSPSLLETPLDYSSDQMLTSADGSTTLLELWAAYETPGTTSPGDRSGLTVESDYIEHERHPLTSLRIAHASSLATDLFGTVDSPQHTSTSAADSEPMLTSIIEQSMRPEGDGSSQGPSAVFEATDGRALPARARSASGTGALGIPVKRRDLIP
ncbi:hypothetical protein K466DRAFT_597539 [Polyporus arcularius HHB13444]|uniref:Fungal-type protein kinase domain-containing protein n=1 Tax=Polyporus arcularius HHB13444 TaxID=1314778 RepID=A0A5C3PIU7_9APHY|nr:hypothetical protein K466DRAFT_597539 [Polyporus arcularius HHB13444]